MGKIIIEGAHPLFGKVSVGGSKNAALPVIFATLATHGISEVTSLPDIEDVRVALSLIRELGARVDRCDDVTYIDTRHMSYAASSCELVNKIRASTYLLGGKLACFGRAEIMDFGGCSFSPRPIDMHISALESLGCKLDGNIITADNPHGAIIDFRQKSVGATVNALIYAAGINSESVIKNCAREPHVDVLISFLRSSGAKINVLEDCVRVVGGELTGGKIAIPGDMIEAGTYISMSLATGGRVFVNEKAGAELSSFIDVLLSSGVVLSERDGALALTGIPSSFLEIVTSPYPGFPTDLQPIITPLIALGCGGSITDTVWPERFGYLNELSKMGLKYIRYGNKAEIYKGRFKGTHVSAPDLRGCASLMIAGMSAVGTTVIDNAEILLRGYEKPIEKLLGLGAKIKYEE